MPMNEEGQVTKGTLCVKGTGYKERIEDENPLRAQAFKVKFTFSDSSEGCCRC